MKKFESDVTIKKMIDIETVTKAVEEITLIRKSLDALFFESAYEKDAKTYIDMCIEELNMHREQTLKIEKEI